MESFESLDERLGLMDLLQTEDDLDNDDTEDLML